MMMRRERRQGGPADYLSSQMLSVQLAADNHTLSRMTGRATMYDTWVNRLWYQLSIARGALDKSISEAGARLPLLLYHNEDSFPIGSALDWDSRRDGLYALWEVFDTPQAQQAATLAQQGGMTGLSIRFQTILAEWELSEAEPTWPVVDTRNMDRMTLMEGRLLETSLLPIPAFDGARVSTVLGARPRHADATPKLDSWRKWADSLHL